MSEKLEKWTPDKINSVIKKGMLAGGFDLEDKGKTIWHIHCGSRMLKLENPRTTAFVCQKCGYAKLIERTISFFFGEKSWNEYVWELNLENPYDYSINGKK
ncbi:MAG: hypothetical protein KAI72_09490 [Candidatus Pacebacteria bacterium]|nr:hypothetical protein [Candidatus Paceibacterota bacterium]